MTSSDFYWLVGYFEGEGCINLPRPSNPRSVGITIASTDEDVIYKATRLLDTIYWPLQHKGNRQLQHVFSITCSKACGFLSASAPLLSQRRALRVKQALTLVKEGPRFLEYYSKFNSLVQDSKETKCAWLAGILEGEGYFGFRKDKNYSILQLAMTDEDTVQRVQSYIGGSVRRVDRSNRPNHKDIYRLEVCSQRALLTMKSIYPLMGIRRKQQIDNILDLEAGRKRRDERISIKHLPFQT